MNVCTILTVVVFGGMCVAGPCLIILVGLPAKANAATYETRLCNCTQFDKSHMTVMTDDDAQPFCYWDQVTLFSCKLADINCIATARQKFLNQLFPCVVKKQDCAMTPVRLNYPDDGSDAIMWGIFLICLGVSESIVTCVFFRYCGYPRTTTKHQSRLVDEAEREPSQIKGGPNSTQH